MDYTHQFFAGTQPFQQQFIGIPPLTPSHSNSATSDDYTTTSPPVSVFASCFSVVFTSLVNDSASWLRSIASEEEGLSLLILRTSLAFPTLRTHSL